MKRISTILIATLLFFVMACSNDKAPSNPGPQQVIPPTNQPAPPINTNTIDNSAASNAPNAAGQFHYVCPNGDGGGAGAAGACPNCGAQLVHNQAFHDNPAQNTPQINNPITPQTPTNTAQNAAGEWHYACPNGHPGSGTAGSCATCGAQLAHNQAYHAGETNTPNITTSPTTPGQPISPLIQQPQSNTPTINVPSSPGTATNSKGAYHYICPNGDAGGAGSAGNCAKCGAQLVHNQAYHN